MLSFIPTILLAIQLIILYFDKDIFKVSNNSFYLVILIILLNTIVISSVSILSIRNNKIPFETKLTYFFGKRSNGRIVFLIFFVCFFVQLIINKNIPIVASYFVSTYNYTTWARQPFSGIMSLTFLIILIERTSVWVNLIKNKQENNNTTILIIMISISLMMLRRDLFGFVLSSGAIVLFNVCKNSLLRLIKNLIVKIKDLIIFRNLISLFLSFLLAFVFIGNLRGQGTGLSREYWKVVFVYISSPLANSLAIIENDNSNYMGVADFFLSRSNTGKTIMKSIGITPGYVPKNVMPLPQFNVFSSLGFYFQLFGRDLYIYMVVLSTGLLAFLEKLWKKKYPILFIAILLISCSSIFSHFFGSITVTIIFPIIYLLQTRRARLK
ncbi:hypothetical protein OA495_02065 [Prochlorococcus sp. AH-716-I07]|nr:hypothetical protein [Prochlorococcus sp. AH-716-I07]